MRVKVGGLQFEGIMSKELVRGVVNVALKSEVDLFLLPENWLSRRPVPLKEYLRVLRTLSLESSTYVIGAQYVLEDGILKSVGYIAGPGGDVFKICEKIFPSNSLTERTWLKAGRIVFPVRVLGINVGCVICVDIFYPEVSRYLTFYGADLILNPSSISSDRIHIWRSVVVARAVENEVYLLGVNKVRSPYPRDRETGGGSLLVDPEGNVVAQLTEEVGVIKAWINVEDIKNVEARRGFRGDLKRYLSRWLIDPAGLRIL